jgi:hypothetical protein
MNEVHEKKSLLYFIMFFLWNLQNLVCLILPWPHKKQNCSTDILVLCELDDLNSKVFVLASFNFYF